MNYFLLRSKGPFPGGKVEDGSRCGGGGREEEGAGGGGAEEVGWRLGNPPAVLPPPSFQKLILFFDLGIDEDKPGICLSPGHYPSISRSNFPLIKELPQRTNFEV